MVPTLGIGRPWADFQRRVLGAERLPRSNILGKTIDARIWVDYGRIKPFVETRSTTQKLAKGTIMKSSAYVLFLSVFLMASAANASPYWIQLTQPDGSVRYWGNDDYACSGNHYTIYHYGSQDTRGFIGTDCDEPGERISIPVYSQQGWDCDEIFMFEDFECYEPPAVVATGVWEVISDQYWGNDDYECSGNNYPIMHFGTQDIRDIEGEDCDPIGAMVSAPIYSQQGWDCEDIFLFVDLECVE